MKKNIIAIAVLAMLIVSLPAKAATSVEVSAITPFNSLTPTQTIKVVTMKKVEFENGIVFEDGTVIEGDVIDLKQPKRAKLNASFKFQPTSYTYKGKTTKVLDPDFIAKYTEKKELNKGDLALSAATTVGGMFVKFPGLSQGVSMVKGMVKNPEGNRLKSGAVQVYKDSPLSYVEEGKDIVINKDDIFYLKFKTHKAEDLDAVAPNNVTPIDETQKINSTLPKDNSTLQINTTVDTKQQPANIKSIQTVHPDEVLREVELNSK